ncbi:hypothetical protein LQ327_03620 [Actinomycetospora endophytica]|uniref:Uncharacterized protein n=1 Tax=Actinomycetospora endophytica TaxID=2291215 RepID=A0ABS8P2K2_9PSEU|nr:hypothetical protein [Actinomycetospora endophytica]MCD2192482.1 hypothetical protein [Actinomycetospora endophytica]
MRVMLDLVRSRDGRLEGTAATEAGREHPFSGTLELLRVLEDLQPSPQVRQDLPGSPR